MARVRFDRTLHLASQLLDVAMPATPSELRRAYLARMGSVAKTAATVGDQAVLQERTAIAAAYNLLRRRATWTEPTALPRPGKMPSGS